MELARGRPLESRLIFRRLSWVRVTFTEVAPNVTGDEKRAVPPRLAAGVLYI